MGKGKRNSTIVISSSDDDEYKDSSSAVNFRFSKSAPPRKNPKRAKRVSLPGSRSVRQSGSNGFDEVKRFCEEFDQGFTQLKVTSGCRSDKDQWVEKYKPSCLEELAVHKKKVDEVQTWIEERLRNTADTSCSNVMIISGQAGVGKSATIHAIACHLVVEVCEWNTPVPTTLQEHLHNSNSGMRYTSKLDDFESFVERIRKYGLISSSLSRVSPILLIDDLPVVYGRVSYERLRRSLHLLLQSVLLPTVILINDYSKTEPTDNHFRYWEELQISLQNSGARKVSFNPITVNSIKRVLLKICRLEKLDLSDEQIDILAKASGGDIRHAITSLQYFSLKPDIMNPLPASKRLPINLKEKGNETSHLNDGVSLPFGKDAYLSLFHALGKFLHNKREESTVASDTNEVPLKAEFLRCPPKMDAPELILSQAHGQTRVVTDFLYENVLDFVNEEAIEDVSVISTYIGDTDLLLAPLCGSLRRSFEAENVIQAAAASVAVRGVLFGNTNPVTSRWHAIRRPKIWEAERSMWSKKNEMMMERRGVQSSINLSNISVFATEFKPALNWLGHRVHEDTGGQQLLTEDEYDGTSLNEEDYEMEDYDEIEDW